MFGPSFIFLYSFFFSIFRSFFLKQMQVSLMSLFCIFLNFSFVYSKKLYRFHLFIQRTKVYSTHTIEKKYSGVTGLCPNNSTDGVSAGKGPLILGVLGPLYLCHVHLNIDSYVTSCSLP